MTKRTTTVLEFNRYCYMGEQIYAKSYRDGFLGKCRLSTLPGEDNDGLYILDG